MRFLLLFTLFTVLPQWAKLQDVYTQGLYQFTAYEKIRAWSCVASDWQQEPHVHLYDNKKYKGHADFVSFGLKKGITFAQFKQQVKDFDTRNYLPFFIYDLRKNPIKQNGIAYTWVVWLEDYSYTDTPEQMRQTVIKLNGAVEKFIGERVKGAKGLMLLAVNEKAKPNLSLKTVLAKNGVESITFNELNAHFNTSKTLVLNSGKAFGKLVYVKHEENDKILLSAQDIAVYEKSPLRVPPVAGIITLEPQTPLSHVNLLAKNRGTINVCTDQLSSITNLEKYLGKFVRITCSKNSVVIKEISKTQYESLLDSARQNNNPLMHLPETQPLVKFIVSLDTTVQEFLKTNCVGAKAANFSLIQKELPVYVGKGYAIPFTFYTEHLKQCGIDKTIDSLQQAETFISKEGLEKCLERIRKKITSAKLDSMLVKKVLDLQKEQFGGRRIRLRSSTNCEDLPNFNGAGLYLSKGFSKRDGKKQLEKDIKEVFASLWTEHAFKERAFYHIRHSEAKMAILISEAYENEWANGVALTIPVEKSTAVYVNSQPGDNLVTNPKGGEIPEAVFFNSSADTSFEIRSQSSFGKVFLQDGMSGLLNELKEVSSKIHALLTKNESGKYGTDIEFKIIDCFGSKRIVIKQARLLYNATPY